MLGKFSYLYDMVRIIKIGTKRVLRFRDLEDACKKMGWNYAYLKKKDISSPVEYRGHFICHE